MRRLLVACMLLLLSACGAPVPTSTTDNISLASVELPTQTPWVIVVTATPEAAREIPTVSQPTATRPPTRTFAPTRTPTALSATPTPEPTASPSLVLAAQLNVRTGPGTNYPTFGYLSAGDTLFVLGRAEGLPWIKLGFADQSHGWVSAAPELIHLERPLEEYSYVIYDQLPGCDPYYPTICIWYGSYDVDCPDINAGNFLVLPPDPHRLDGDGDGRGCEWN